MPIYVFWERSGYNLNQKNFPIFDHKHYPNLRTDFWVRNRGNLGRSPLVNCSHINELDVKLLNFSIRTSIAQVMALFP